MKFSENIPTIFIGYDPREHDAYRVLKYSILKHSSEPINVFPIDQIKLRRMGIYRRAWLLGSSEKPMPKNSNDSQQVDIFDNRPYSTDFSFTRFLIPFLNRYEGWALYLDCDMYFRSDPMEILINIEIIKKLFIVLSIDINLLKKSKCMEQNKLSILEKIGRLSCCIIVLTNHMKILP